MAAQRTAGDRGALRVGFLSPVNSLDPDALSGMPWRMRAMLESRGLEIVALDRRARATARPVIPKSLRHCVPPIARQAWRSTRQRLATGLEWATSSTYERRMLRRAHAQARDLSERIRNAAPDVLFGCCISSMMYALETDVPIVYFSDATALLINGTYPTYRSRCPAYKRLCDLYERETMSRIAMGVFASRQARESAVVDYGLDRGASRVVPMGAHITPDADTELRFDAPSRGELRLCIVASDARRKRVGLAVQTTERLRQMGWGATLTQIGQPSRGVHRSQCARSLGRLRLSSAADRMLMAQTLAESHLMILPSVGEAFGIAPCEAAHFGQPSVVSAAGGLPEVVEDGKSGLVLPVSANAQDYAEAIAALAGDEPRYRLMSRAALAKARCTLNWDAWADGVAPLIRGVASSATSPTERFAPIDRESCSNAAPAQIGKPIEIESIIVTN